LVFAIDARTLQVFLILFAATAIRSAFGFGEALIAVPLLAFFMPLKVAAPLAVLVSITIASIVVIQDWRKIHLLSTGWLVLSTLFGIPLGLLLLTSVYQRSVKAALASIIIAFSVYSLAGRAPVELRQDSRRWLIACGLCAGILGGAYGMNGEIGIRGALGARRVDILRLILSGTMTQTTIGIAIGIPASLGAGRLLADQLYGVKPYDPLVLGIAALTLIGCAAWLRSDRRCAPAALIRRASCGQNDCARIRRSLSSVIGKLVTRLPLA
jgi:hypothetical protein